MEARKTLLIVYHSLTNGTRQMAEAARAGAQADGSVEVRLLHASAAGPEDVLAADGNLSIARYVKRPKAAVAGGATLAATWAAFDEDGREFWSGMDALVDMLDGLTPSEDADA